MNIISLAARFIILTLISLTPLAFSQTPAPCSYSDPASGRDRRNIFSLVQETDLGDALAESQLSGIRILIDGDANIQRIAARLVRNTPLAQLPIRSYIVDIPQANAFVLPGGRVYVSRALIALLESEDELAGVLAHEFGHIAAHQQAIVISELMKSTLGFAEVGDRRDIFDKYGQTIESAWKKPNVLKRAANREEKDQIEADRLGLLMLAAAGYDPAAQIRAFDRLAETKGKTGSFLSNLFNFDANQKRLGELVKNLPSGCAAGATPPVAEFLAWRKGLLNDTSMHLRESLNGIESRVTLRPPLRGDLRDLRFSPDGRYALAADETGVTVLTVEPFRVLFRIPVDAGGSALFTPDSRQVAILISSTRIERWSVASGERSESFDLPLRQPCATELLSADGRVAACLEVGGTLRLLDTASGETILERKDFADSSAVSIADNPIAAIRFGDSGRDMGFSTDARYFFALPHRPGTAPLGWDLEKKAPVVLRGELKKLPRGYFAFVAPDRLMISPAGAAPGSNVTGKLLSFPAGEVLATPTLPSGPIFRTADPGWVLVRPLGKFAAGAVEYASGNVVTNKVPALDVVGRFYAAERLSGELALYEKGRRLVATVQLPEAGLGGLRASAVSPDLSWIAISAGARGELWNLRTGAAVAMTAGFDQCFFDKGGQLLADVAKSGDEERHVLEITPNPFRSEARSPIKGNLVHQVGPHYASIGTADGSPPQFNLATGTFLDITLDVMDARTAKSQWSQKIRGEAPLLFFESSAKSAVFLWSATTERVRRDATLKSTVSRLGSSTSSDDRVCDLADFFNRGLWEGQPLKSGVYVAEALDLATGEAKRSWVVDLVDRCLRVKSALAFGDAVLVEDNRNRVLVYRADSPQPRLRLFGSLLDADAARNRIAVGKGNGRVVVYDGVSGAQIEDFSFAVPLVLVRLARDGGALFALTAQHEAITLKVH